ncbi:tagatose-6-phosphate kinase [Mesorhizobium sp.]|uniref:tagatose-6-phosphate kinase n=1 Tax=Mesorhizobium sp. TaxID=1871066 RepID=UPI0025E1C275|nr:tagatose-6-phosphate kinase [Mesorhizobium sp.]
MSKNTVEACGSIASRYGIPLMLIASRRQIDKDDLGGGYVENWTTQTLSEHIRKKFPPEDLLLCRDHGGPWQHPSEREYSEERAKKSCLESFKEDIRAGFDLLHIDTSAERTGIAAADKAVERLVELYGECHDFARGLGRSLRFEIGFEDQSVDTDYPSDFKEKLHCVLKRLADLTLPLPTFVVAQTGTKVLETENVGAIMTAPLAVRHSIEHLSNTCREMGVELKAHNADYLPSEKISILKRSGVSALNIAPEFGVAETRSFVSILKELNLSVQLERFLELAFESSAWKKWIKPNSQASDTDRAIIAGHYVFGTERYRAIKSVAESACHKLGKSLDESLQSAVERSIERYVLAFAA